MNSLWRPLPAGDALRSSVQTVLRQVGWKEEELLRSAYLVMDKLAPYPAIENGVTDLGITEPAHTRDTADR